MVGNAVSLILGLSVTKQLCQFLHNCIDNLVTKSHPIPDIPPSEIDWSEEDLKEARNFIKIIYRKMVTCQDYNVEEDLSEFSAEQIDCIKECYNMRKSEIQEAVVMHVLSKEKSLVTDYDWKLKWVIGSSTLSAFKQPLVQMDLRTMKTDKENKITMKNINFEMNCEELNNFIEELEKCIED